ncbi:hypothetical protein [Acinetobacter bereziniae]|nr:hypothetical protein [Acinetobacter bereziniae]
MLICLTNKPILLQNIVEIYGLNHGNKTLNKVLHDCFSNNG